MNTKIEKTSLKQLLIMISSSTLGVREICRLSGYHSDKVRFIKAVLPTCPFDLANLDQIPDSALDAWLKSYSHKASQKFHNPDLVPIAKALGAKSATRWELFNRYLQEPSHLRKMSFRTFNDRIQKFESQPDLVLRLDHRPGESMQIDYAGYTPSYIDQSTGLTAKRQLFVSVCGVAALIFATSTPDQSVTSWLKAHVAAINFYAGVPLIWVCDNLKAGVLHHKVGGRIRLNPVYRALAEYYNALVKPARPYRPRDKGRVEAAVKLVQNEVRRSLENRPVYSADELNARILEVVTEINNRPMARLNGTTRRQSFEEIDRPHLQPMPITPFEYFDVELGRSVGRDYSVSFQGNHYSVDHQLAGKLADVHASSTEVMIVSDGIVVAVHPRLSGKNRSSYLEQHRPANHRAMLMTDSDRLAERLKDHSASTSEFINRAINAQIKTHSRRAALDTALLLTKAFSADEMEAAVSWCEGHGIPTIGALEACLTDGLWQSSASTLVRSACPIIEHGNLRGPEYFSRQGGAK